MGFNDYNPYTLMREVAERNERSRQCLRIDGYKREHAKAKLLALPQLQGTHTNIFIISVINFTIVSALINKTRESKKSGEPFFSLPQFFFSYFYVK